MCIRDRCVAKLTEAEAMANGGVSDILITNQIVSRPKIQRLLPLAQHCHRLAVCVDNATNVQALQSVFGASEHVLDVLVEVDVGQGRCCLLYTSPSPRDRTRSRMPSSA
eukprot:TRINITY_DN20861_c0_g1_i1.p1 TRINITY_DN20861_c0_g1~~TRINITY_DN20861_c0_g1_i1.p1  ORF type:complete len:109 (+),score=34.17 TRINITY_DN20861_c0_g1_i1:149-475(+)